MILWKFQAYRLPPVAWLNSRALFSGKSNQSWCECNKLGMVIVPGSRLPGHLKVCASLKWDFGSEFAIELASKLAGNELFAHSSWFSELATRRCKFQQPNLLSGTNPIDPRADVRLVSLAGRAVGKCVLIYGFNGHVSEIIRGCWPAPAKTAPETVLLIPFKQPFPSNNYTGIITNPLSNHTAQAKQYTTSLCHVYKS